MRFFFLHLAVFSIVCYSVQGITCYTRDKDSAKKIDEIGHLDEFDCTGTCILKAKGTSDKTYESYCMRDPNQLLYICPDGNNGCRDGGKDESSRFHACCCTSGSCHSEKAVKQFLSGGGDPSDKPVSPASLVAFSAAIAALSMIVM